MGACPRHPEGRRARKSVSTLDAAGGSDRGIPASHRSGDEPLRMRHGCGALKERNPDRTAYELEQADDYATVAGTAQYTAARRACGSSSGRVSRDFTRAMIWGGCAGGCPRGPPSVSS